MMIAAAVLLTTNLLLIYLAYVQNKKYIALMKYTEMYVQFIGAIAIRTKATHDQMLEIDRNGSFQVDDEVGVIFNEIKNNVKDLNDFIEKYVNTGTEEEKSKKE